MIIAYSDGYEVLVCEKKNEKEMLKIWFKKGGRNLEDYDRDESKFVFEIKTSASIHVNNS